MSERVYVFDPNRLVSFWVTRTTENIITRIITRDERYLFNLISTVIQSETRTTENVTRLCNFVERRRSPRCTRFDINCINEEGTNPLALCIARIKRWKWPETRTDMERVKRLVVHTMISHGANVHMRIYTKTMLQIACESQCQFDIVQLLIDEGISVNNKDEHQHTPLHCAALMADVSVVLLLIEKGADVTARNDINESPITCLMSVFAHERMRVGEPWFSRIDTILDLFLYNGANLNDISIAPSEGQSCLFRAINGIGLDSNAANVNFIRKLLSLEAEVNIGYVKGDDNLVYDDNFLVEWENGDSVTYVRGDTPLHAAVCIGRLYIVKLLLEYNADMNIKNRLGHTPLDYAIIYEHDEIQKAMILYTRKKRYDYS